LTRLCATLIGHYPLIRPERVVGHCHVSPGRKVDPGPKFDWEGFRRGLQTMIKS
jgi:AmpD protein